MHLTDYHRKAAYEVIKQIIMHRAFPQSSDNLLVRELTQACRFFGKQKR